MASPGDNPQQEPKKMKTEPQEGRLSRLPDELLLSILSLLPATQPAQTTVLSKRWLNLWKLYVKNLRIIVSPSFKFSNFKFINKSSIHTMKIDAVDAENIIANCPFLEEFCLVRSNSVRNLKVCSKSLKKLEILGCCSMRTLEFLAPNLVSFKYNGPDVEFVFSDVSSLVEVSFVESYCMCLVRRNFEQFGPILEQIEEVNVILDFPWITEFPRVEGLKNVKKVRLDVSVWDYQKPLLLFGSMIQVLPSLDVFWLRLFWPEDKNEIMDVSNVEFENHQPHRLRLFKMDGFVSAGWELTFIEYVVNRAVSLEKVVVRVCRRASVESDEDLMCTSERESVTYDAHEYIPDMVPSPTRFVLL